MRTVIQPSANSKNLILTTSPPPVADPSKGEHLIRVKACSPCAGELLWPEKYLPHFRELVPCPDVVGTIISAPADSPFQPGDEVYGRTSFSRPANAREYTIGLTSELSRKAKTLSWAEAAAVPLSAVTAWQALFIHAGIVKNNDTDIANAQTAWRGKRVLITAASGGVGQWAVQLASLLGAEVIGTCGPDNVALVKSLGASEVLNYREIKLQQWAELPDKKVDVVIDCIGQKSLEDAWWTVKDGGFVLSIVHDPEQVRPVSAKVQGVKSLFFIVEPKRVHLEEITKFIEEGKCKPVVDSIWPLEQFEEAFKRLDSGHARGKIIFDLSLNQ